VTDTRKEALARQIIRRMHRDPDEVVPVPGGGELPLWKVAADAMERIPAPLRALLDAQGRSKPLTARQTLGRWLRRLRHDSVWTDPRDGLPPAVNEGGVLSDVVLVKRVDKIETAVLLYGTPIGSHRWILNKDQPDEHYLHVLDIDGWRELEEGQAQGT
jgi:hypothetical protein